MIVYLNPRAHGGQAAARWQRVRPALEAAGLLRDPRVVTDPAELEAALAAAPRTVVAAGGDGTVHAVVNAVARLPGTIRATTAIGAVALGSSNDFHQPLEERRWIAGVPVRLDEARSAWHDLGVLELLDRPGGARRAFVLSASVGIIANGNRTFNGAGRAWRAFKRRAVGAAIACATVRTVVASRPVAAHLTLGDGSLDAELTSASFLLSPFVSGALRYDVDGSDGNLAVALCGRMGLLRRVRTLVALSRGRFSGLPGTRVLRARRVQVELDGTVPVELDGEVLLARAFRVSVAREAVRLCA